MGECLRPLDPLLDLGRDFDYVSVWEHDRDPGNPLVAAGTRIAHPRSHSVLRALAHIGRLDRKDRGWITTGPCWTSLTLVYPNMCNEEWKSRLLSYCGGPWIKGPAIPCADTPLPMKILSSELFYPIHWSDISKNNIRPVPKHAFTLQHWSSTIRSEDKSTKEWNHS